MEDKEFKKQLEVMVIPLIKDMLKKESNHLSMLEKSEKKFNKIDDFFYAHKINFTNMIGKSKAVKLHLETRLKEYIEYAEKL